MDGSMQSCHVAALVRTQPTASAVAIMGVLQCYSSHMAFLHVLETP